MKSITMKHNEKRCDFKMDFMTIKVGITKNKNTIEKLNIFDITPSPMMHGRAYFPTALSNILSIGIIYLRLDLAKIDN